jgi:hypothetical protein
MARRGRAKNRDLFVIGIARAGTPSPTLSLSNRDLIEEQLVAPIRSARRRVSGADTRSDPRETHPVFVIADTAAG